MSTQLQAVMAKEEGNVVGVEEGRKSEEIKAPGLCILLRKFA